MEILNLCENELRQFNSVNAVSALHRIAKTKDSKELGVTEDHRLARLVGFCFENVQKMSGLALANVAWSLVHLKYKDADMMSALARETMLKIDDMNVQHLSSVVWAFSSLRMRNEELFMAIAEESVRRIDEYTPANLGMTAWAYGVAKIKRESMLTALIDESTKKVQGFSEQQLGQICNSFRSLERQFEAGQLQATWQQLQPE